MQAGCLRLQTYTHNIYYLLLSTVTMVARRSLNVTLHVHCPSCLLYGSNDLSPRFINVYAGILKFDVHGSVHHNTNLIEMTNKMHLCRTIYYSIVP